MTDDDVERKKDHQHTSEEEGQPPNGKDAEELERLKKRSITNELIADLRHEINNPLTYISTNLGYADRQLDAVLEFIAELEYTLRHQLDEESAHTILAHLQPHRIESIVEGLREALDDAQHGNRRIRDIFNRVRNQAREQEEHDSSPDKTGDDSTTASETEVPSSQRARVLVVDDEPRFRRALRRILKRRHDVVLTDGSEQALQKLVAGEHFDVILCDLMMAESTGMDFYYAVERAHPEYLDRIVFMSGGAFTARAKEFLRNTTNRYIEKPFDHKQLYDLIAEFIAP